MTPPKKPATARRFQIAVTVSQEELDALDLVADAEYAGNRSGAVGGLAKKRAAQIKSRTKSTP